VCNKYESFTRQLNAWGFKRLYQSGSDSGCHYHECFLRGLPKLTCLIRRLPPSQGKSTPYPAGEPNFFKISAKFPLPPSASSDASAKIPVVEEEVAIAPSPLDSSFHGRAPSQIALPTFSTHTSTHGQSPGLQCSPSAHTPAQSHSQEPSYQESMASLTPVAMGVADPRHRGSTEIQYQSSSLPQEHTMGDLAASSRMTYEPPHHMSRYTQGYQYQSSYPHATSNPTNYTVPFGHPGQHFYSGSGQYATQGQTPQYQYQTPQERYQRQSHERPRFRYPPPQMPQYLNFAPGSSTTIRGHLLQGTYHYYQGNVLYPGQPLPPSPRNFGGREGRASRNIDDDGMLTDPLPYSSRLNSDSSALKEPKPDPPS